MPLTVQNVCGLLIRSRLQSPDSVKTIYQRWESEAKHKDSLREFSRWLVSKQYLTDYQATLISNGHADNFFLGQYKILDRIGRGRMAGVYKAMHMLGQTVAIKVLPPSKAKDPQVLARFQREARLSIQLNHPSVVRTFQVGESNGLHYIVMEYLEGQTLEELLQQRTKLPPREAVRIGFLASLGLQHIQDKGMVHRDMKPGNLMLVPAPAPNENTLRSMVKILDIGLGRTLFDPRNRDGKDDLTTEGVILGTPDYLAPEQARDSRKADIRADIYSLGCAMYHMIAGQPPFVDDNPIRLILRHNSEQPKPLKEFNREVPGELSEIILKMMAKDPAQRYATPAKVAEALKAYLAGEPEAPKPRAESKELLNYLEWLNKPDAAKTGAAGPAPPADQAVSEFPLPARAKHRRSRPKPLPSAERLEAHKRARREQRVRLLKRLIERKRARAVAKVGAQLINVEPVNASDLPPPPRLWRDTFMVLLGALSVLGIVLLMWVLNKFDVLDVNDLQKYWDDLTG